MEKQRDAGCTITGTLLTLSGTNSTTLLEEKSPGQHPARCYTDAAGLWQQPLGKLGASAVPATADFEGEGIAPHFCQLWLSTQRSTRGSSATRAWRTLLCLQKVLPQMLLLVELLLSGVQITLHLWLQNHIQTFFITRTNKYNTATIFLSETPLVCVQIFKQRPLQCLRKK